MPQPTFIFDFDGTIADTMDVIVDIYNRSIALRFRCKPIAESDRPRLRGAHPRDVMREYGVTVFKLPLMVLRARAELARRIHEIQPFPSMVQVLQSLESKGVTVGVLTTNSRTNVTRFFERHGLAHTFKFIYTNAFAFSRHRTLRRIMRKHKLSPRDTIFVADEVRDIDAARAAGIRIAAVAWGYNLKEALERRGPDWMIESPEALVSLASGSPEDSGAR